MSSPSPKSTRKRLALLGQFSRPLLFGLSVLLFTLSIALHFVQRGSLAEFIVSIIAIVPISAVIRFATKDIIFKLISKEYEFLAGLLNGIFGYSTLHLATLEEKLTKN